MVNFIESYTMPRLTDALLYLSSNELFELNEYARKEKKSVEDSIPYQAWPMVNLWNFSISMTLCAITQDLCKSLHKANYGKYP